MTSPARRQASGPFSSHAVLWMVVVGCVSALMFLVLNAYAPQLRGESNGEAHAMSTSAIGFAGLVELLRDERIPTGLSRDPHHPPRSPPESLFVLTPGPGTSAKAMQALTSSGVELIILPKRVGAPDPSHPGWLIGGEVLQTETVAAVLRAFDHGDHIERRSDTARPSLKTTSSPFQPGGTIPVGEIDSLQTIVGPDPHWLSVIETEPGHALLIKKSDQPIFVLSDPDLMNNQGLAQLANARGATVLINALRGGQSPVAFDLSLAGFARSRSLLGLAFEPPFLAATLCAIAAAGLMGLRAAARFGPPLRPTPAFALGKRALADNSAALIRLVRREYAMGAGYAALTRGLAARAVGAPRDLDDDQMDALLDRLAAAKGVAPPFSDLERRARDARDLPALMSATEALFKWRLEMTHERR